MAKYNCRIDRDRTKSIIICLSHSISQSTHTTHTANCTNTNKSHCHHCPATPHSPLNKFLHTPFSYISLYNHTSSSIFLSYTKRLLFFVQEMGEGGCESNGAIVYGKKMLKRLVRRVRAEMRKMRKLKHRNDFSFCYDPLSYALNFDDGNFGFFCT